MLLGYVWWADLFMRVCTCEFLHYTIYNIITIIIVIITLIIIMTTIMGYDKMMMVKKRDCKENEENANRSEINGNIFYTYPSVLNSLLARSTSDESSKRVVCV